MEIFGIPAEAFLSQGIFVLLFVWLFYDSRQESKEREEKLMEQLGEQNKTQGRIVKILERLEDKINNLLK